jgi:DNA mismatch repair protein MutS
MTSTLDKYFKIQKELIEKYGEKSITLYQVGSFYEMYGGVEGDLREVANYLNFHLTRKNKADKMSAWMCGFPDFALEKHLSKLVVQHKYTIAVYDQKDVEGQKGKDRVLKEIVSPSTYLSDEVHISNELFCIAFDSFTSLTNKVVLNNVCLSSIDLSTGRSRCSECIDNMDNRQLCVNEVIKWIHTRSPCEIILAGDTDNKIYKEVMSGRFSHIKIHHRDIDKKYYNLDYQKEFLKKLFSDTMVPHQFGGNGELVGCYLYMLQFAFEHDPLIVSKLHYPSHLHTAQQLYLNNDCIYELNLFSQSENQTSSLFDIINKTKTKMGYRLVRDRLMNPICDVDVLNRRYDKIDAVWDSVDEYRPILSNILDIEKKYRKMILRRLQPHEFANLNTSFKNIYLLLHLGKTHFGISDKSIGDVGKFIDDYTNIFDIDKMEKYNEISYIKSGISETIDDLNRQLVDINTQFAEIQTWLMDVSAGRANIKIVMTERDGMHFSTTKKCWEKLQNSGGKYKDNVIKCVSNRSTVKLKMDMTDILYYRYEGIVSKLRKETGSFYEKTIYRYEVEMCDVFEEMISLVSEIDLSVTFALISRKSAYTRPVIKQNDRSYVKGVGVRHPIIEKIHDDVKYIPNDVDVGTNRVGYLVYGLNSSGKSTLLRSIGCNIVLAQMGMFVASKSFEYHPYKKLLTKISSSDNIFKGQSTFIVEMNELNEILTKADKHSLVLCDELTSGTETNSATGLVASSLKYLLGKDVHFMMSTHLHGIVEFNELVENDKLYVCHFDILIKDKGVECDRVLKPGSGRKTYGIEIAKVIGLDKTFIRDAYEYRARYENGNMDFLQNKRSRYNKKVVMDCCKMCGAKDNLHTHHICEQRDADEDGVIDQQFHKNVTHNLLVLCETCHQKIHN